ncbi:NnrU protein [Palleronia aestuarii]|uniref:NnrU protein n=1 Tax=Palleronia aestuarii TaxID=568105 RepID=A0A2W7ND95_9RHOB|nr:NnrU family protein [Palleronia aestuarii]PZX18355.1 NnrU protein [Palleronia aestuarii]
MILLLLGLALWIGAHVFKRVAPAARGAMQDRLGNASKGLFAVLLVLSVVLMVWGYRGAPYIAVWTPPVWTVHLNNTLMYVAIFVFGLSHSKSSLRARTRHPQLWGFSIWAVAHLLVNGDLASILLFGVLLLWAFAEMALINAQEGDYVPYQGGSKKGTVRLALIALVLYAVITAIHAWLGVWPFPG